MDGSTHSNKYDCPVRFGLNGPITCLINEQVFVKSMVFSKLYQQDGHGSRRHTNFLKVYSDRMQDYYYFYSSALAILFVGKAA